MTAIRAATIGCGRMGAQPSERMRTQVPAGWLPVSHVEAILAARGVELVAVADSNEQSARKWGAHYRVEHIYTDYRKLIDEVRPDLVTIATRTPVKGEIMRYACERGVRGLYIEKPIANNIADCAELLSLAEANGVRIAYGVNRRYHAAYRQARGLIKDGCIGEVKDIVVEMGESALLWTHPHSVDLILFLGGQTNLIAVQALMREGSMDCREILSVDSDPLIEHAFFRFDGGLTAGVVRAGGLGVRVGGSEGSLTIHGNGAYIQLNTRVAPDSPYFLQQRVIDPVVGQGATVTAIEELVSSMEGGPAPGITPAEIGLGMRMLMGCVWSHLQGGAIIKADEVPARLTVTGRSGEFYA